MELETGGRVRAVTPLLSRIQFVFSESLLMRILFTAGASSVLFFLWYRWLLKNRKVIALKVRGMILLGWILLKMFLIYVSWPHFFFL